MTALTTRTWAAVRAEAALVHSMACDALENRNGRPPMSEQDALDLERMLKAVTLFLNTPAEPASPSGVQR